MVTPSTIAVLSSPPKDFGGDTGAATEVVTVICEPD